VFVPLHKDERPGTFPQTRISSIITDIAKAAGSIRQDQGGRIHWVTVHDMRRNFGTRMSRVMSTATLRDVIRYSDMATTARST
jgi:hypothetical protein